MTVVGALAWLWTIGAAAAVLRCSGLLPAAPRWGSGASPPASPGAALGLARRLRRSQGELVVRGKLDGVELRVWDEERADGRAPTTHIALDVGAAAIGAGFARLTSDAGAREALKAVLASHPSAALHDDELRLVQPRHELLSEAQLAEALCVAGSLAMKVREALGADRDALTQARHDVLHAPANALADELAELALLDPTLAAQVAPHYWRHADAVVALQAMLALPTPLAGAGQAAHDHQRLLIELRDAYARGEGEALLLEAVSSTLPSRRDFALRVLAEGGPTTFASPELEPRVLARLAAAPAGERSALVAALGAIGGRHAVTALYAALDDGGLSSDERSATRQALALLQARLGPGAAGALSVAAPTLVGALSAATPLTTEGALSEVEVPWSPSAQACQPDPPQVARPDEGDARGGSAAHGLLTCRHLPPPRA